MVNVYHKKNFLKWIINISFKGKKKIYNTFLSSSNNKGIKICICINLFADLARLFL